MPVLRFAGLPAIIVSPNHTNTRDEVIMTTCFRPYCPDDFARVRDLLARAWPRDGRPTNWDIVRWNYARYLVAPYLGTYGSPDNHIEASIKGIRTWERLVGVWEDDRDGILGAADPEDPWPSDLWIERAPGYDGLLEEMLRYGEEHLRCMDENLRHRQKNSLTVNVYEHDEPLQALLAQRGYARQAEHPEWMSEYIIDALPKIQLPEGYIIRSMADDNDLAKRCAIYGYGFNHRDPKEWATPFTYAELQKAPNYRQDLDLYVVAPDGEWVACAIAWYDPLNRRGMFEHVGTHLDYRRRGFGRAVVWEGIRRLAALGAEKAYVGSSQTFYLDIGFGMKWASYNWVKQL